MCEIWYSKHAPVFRYCTKQKYFRIPNSWSISYKQKLSKTSNDIDMKLGPVTKLDKKNAATLKLMMTSYLQIVTSLPFFRFMANLEQFGCRIPETWSVILVFSLTFYLTKTVNRTKKSLTPLSYYCIE